MKKVRAAIIGAGFAGNFHTNAYTRVSGVDFKIKYVYDVVEEKAVALCKKWDIIEQVAKTYEEILEDPEIDVIDIITPPVTHLELAYQALEAGKHVICEKPLTGYFGEEDEEEPIGLTVPKVKMYESLLKDIDECRARFEASNVLFMYAENYVYSPNILRSAEIIEAKKSKIMYMKGEESIRSSTSPAKSVDTEDFATIIITFTDGTKAISISNDNTLGGVKNYVEVYTNDSALVNTITPADNLSTYFLDEDGLEDVYISEQLQEKLGWNKVFVSEETLRGYLNQFQDFVDAVAENREPLSGLDLAYDTIKVIYAAYLSAEEGRRVDF